MKDHVTSSSPRPATNCLPMGIGMCLTSAASALTRAVSSRLTGSIGTAMSVSARTARPNRRVTRCTIRIDAISGNSDANMNDTRSGVSPADCTRCRAVAGV
jgi:hypothetical protein